MCLDIKTHKKWKIKDDAFIGCGSKSEMGEELVICKGHKDGESDKEVSWSERSACASATKWTLT